MHWKSETWVLNQTVVDWRRIGVREFVVYTDPGRLDV